MQKNRSYCSLFSLGFIPNLGGGLHFLQGKLKKLDLVGLSV